MFEEPVTLQDESGAPLNVGNASAAALHDWDNDGDLDLLIGVIEGDVKFVPNLGGSDLPKFGAPQAVNADGNAVKMSGDAGPTIVDWDGDLVDDLVCGDANGSIWFYRATGRTDKGLPTLAQGVELIPAISNEVRMAAYENPVDDPEGKLVNRPGDRVKVCVTDWNADGRLDLLVGDFQMTSTAAPDLTAEDIAERDRLREEQKEVMKQYSALWQQLDARLREKLGIEAETEMTTEQQARWGELYENTSKEIEGFEAINEQLQALWPQLSRFEPKREYHGWVWVYLQKSKAKAAAELIDEQARRIELVEPTALQPLSAGMTVIPTGDGETLTLIVRARVATNWHVYAKVPVDQPYIQTALALNLPEGWEAAGDWSLPESIIDPHAPRLRLWKGELVFSRRVRPAHNQLMSDWTLGCTISYQCCDENQCLPPDTIEMTSPVGPALVRR